jgi:hypothetical protein
MVASRRQKRGYSKEFRAHGNTGKQYLLSEIPAGFWAAVRKQVAADGLSLRGLILTLLRDWLYQRQQEQQAEKDDV